MYVCVYVCVCVCVAGQVIPCIVIGSFAGAGQSTIADRQELQVPQAPPLSGSMAPCLCLRVRLCLSVPLCASLCVCVRARDH